MLLVLLLIRRAPYAPTGSARSHFSCWLVSTPVRFVARLAPRVSAGSARSVRAFRLGAYLVLLWARRAVWLGALVVISGDSEIILHQTKSAVQILRLEDKKLPVCIMTDNLFDLLLIVHASIFGT